MVNGYTVIELSINGIRICSFQKLYSIIISWLERRDMFQISDEDLKCSVVEIRALLDESQ
jgi:hypothetical protein